MIDVAKALREGLRWYLILACDKGRPSTLSEEMLHSIMRGVYPEVTLMEVRRELSYLEERGLLHLRKEPSGRWWSGLTRDGVDIAEYTVDCDPGIARPVKYN